MRFWLVLLTCQVIISYIVGDDIESLNFFQLKLDLRKQECSIVLVTLSVSTESLDTMSETL